MGLAMSFLPVRQCRIGCQGQTPHICALAQARASVGETITSIPFPHGHAAPPGTQLGTCACSAAPEGRVPASSCPTPLLEGWCLGASGGGVLSGAGDEKGPGHWCVRESQQSGGGGDRGTPRLLDCENCAVWSVCVSTGRPQGPQVSPTDEPKYTLNNNVFRVEPIQIHVRPWHESLCSAAPAQKHSNLGRPV